MMQRWRFDRNARVYTAIEKARLAVAQGGIRRHRRPDRLRQIHDC
jgi:hypothetical protein